MESQQLIISGIGGQGILFITRLLAETAIAGGMAVLTSETHGMAQRGGIVISHLKVGGFSSPLVRPGQADGLIALKHENLVLHKHFLREGGWFTVNAAGSDTDGTGSGGVSIDADRLALAAATPQAVNLIVLGRVLAEPGRLFCTIDQIKETLSKKLAGRDGMLKASLAALQAGTGV